MATAFAPGRVTVVGEHVDYAGGVVVCMSVHLGITVALRESRDGATRVDRLPRATLLALQRRAGVELPPLELDIEATLPRSAGLSSSAALCGAVAVAALRLAGVTLPAAELAATMLHAERDIAGVPCGPLDQRAVVHAPPDGVLVLDCGDDSVGFAPWLDGHVLVACHTGDTHDVGGEGYRARRGQAERARVALGVESLRDADDVDGLHDDLLRRRARHIVSETRRAMACADALRRGDAAEVGELMSASHLSLRDDYEVSTPALDAVVSAAQSVRGCLGARLCGAGFGGTAVALVEEGRAQACIDAMQSALPPDARGRGAWVLRPSPGLHALCPDVVR